MEQGLNTELYYKNKEMGETFSIVPTSAITYVHRLHLSFNRAGIGYYRIFLQSNFVILWFVAMTVVKASLICCYY